MSGDDAGSPRRPPPPPPSSAPPAWAFRAASVPPPGAADLASQEQEPPVVPPPPPSPDSGDTGAAGAPPPVPFQPRPPAAPPAPAPRTLPFRAPRPPVAPERIPLPPGLPPLRERGRVPGGSGASEGRAASLGVPSDVVGEDVDADSDSDSDVKSDVDADADADADVVGDGLDGHVVENGSEEELMEDDKELLVFVKAPDYPPPPLEEEEEHQERKGGIERREEEFYPYEYPEGVGESDPRSAKVATEGVTKEVIGRHFDDGLVDFVQRNESRGPRTDMIVTTKRLAKDECIERIRSILLRQWKHDRLRGRNKVISKRKIHQVVAKFDDIKSGRFFVDDLLPILREGLGLDFTKTSVALHDIALAMNYGQKEDPVPYALLLQASDLFLEDLRKRQASISHGHSRFPLDLVIGSTHTARSALSPRTTEEKAAVERKLKQFSRWLHSLKIWERELDVEGLILGCQNGTVLCRLVDLLSSRFKSSTKRSIHGEFLKGVHWNLKGLTRTPCLKNIEIALSIVWKQKGVKARNMPSAMQIYSGDPVSICKLLREIFSSMVFSGNFSTSSRLRIVLNWFDRNLKMLGQSLTSATLNPPHLGLWGTFQKGDLLLLLMSMFSQEENFPIIIEPGKKKEIVSNCKTLEKKLDEESIPSAFTAEEFASAPADSMELLCLLLLDIHLKFKSEKPKLERISKLPRPTKNLSREQTDLSIVTTSSSRSSSLELKAFDNLERVEDTEIEDEAVEMEAAITNHERMRMQKEESRVRQQLEETKERRRVAAAGGGGVQKSLSRNHEQERIESARRFFQRKRLLVCTGVTRADCNVSLSGSQLSWNSSVNSEEFSTGYVFLGDLEKVAIEQSEDEGLVVQCRLKRGCTRLPLRRNFHLQFKAKTDAETMALFANLSTLVNSN